MSRTKEFAAELAAYVYRRLMTQERILAILTDEQTEIRQVHWLQAQIKEIQDHPEIFQPLAEDDFRRWRK